MQLTNYLLWEQFYETWWYSLTGPKSEKSNDAILCYEHRGMHSPTYLGGGKGKLPLWDQIILEIVGGPPFFGNISEFFFMAGARQWNFHLKLTNLKFKYFPGRARVFSLFWLIFYSSIEFDFSIKKNFKKAVYLQ